MDARKDEANTNKHMTARLLRDTARQTNNTAPDAINLPFVPSLTILKNLHTDVKVDNATDAATTSRPRKSLTSAAATIHPIQRPRPTNMRLRPILLLHPASTSPLVLNMQTSPSRMDHAESTVVIKASTAVMTEVNGPRARRMPQTRRTLAGMRSNQPVAMEAVMRATHNEATNRRANMIAALTGANKKDTAEGMARRRESGTRVAGTITPKSTQRIAKPIVTNRMAKATTATGKTNTARRPLGQRD